MGRGARLRVGQCNFWGGRYPADICEPVSKLSMDPNHELDITDTVFESYEIGALISELPQRFDREPTVRSFVVHNARRRRSAHCTNVSNQTTFGCLCEIRRKEQQAVSPRGLRISCQLNRDGCGHSSGCKQWTPPLHLIGCGSDHPVHLRER